LHGEEVRAMPWKETCAVEERRAFIEAWMTREFGMTELSERFGVSRPTAYKWVERFRLEGDAGLLDASCAPHHHPNAVDAQQVADILELKRCHLRWGPVTIHDWLLRERGQQRWPAASTVGQILARHGLVLPRKRRRRTPPQTLPLAAADRPNAVWSADFKGNFALGDRRVCYPLTITDNYSRFLLCCQGLYDPDARHCRPHFERCFRDHGLPCAIRTDNGPPFASIAIGGLSALSVWWIKLGITPERITPGCPQENGRHERMHRTLKAWTASPPKATLNAQQHAFNRFGNEYNRERPHRSLARASPAHRYRTSPRPYPERLPEIAYPDNFILRKVKSGGHMKWHGDAVYITKILEGEYIGLKALSNDCYEVYFGMVPLGIFDARRRRIVKPRPPNV
jgi:transposase InsO family protein